MDFWRTLAAPIIVATFAGIIVGLVLAKTSGPEVPNITAQIRWVDIPNPMFYFSNEKVAEAKKAFESIWGEDAGFLLRRMTRTPTLRISQIDIQNNSDIRSKEIELSSKLDLYMYSQHAKEKQQQFRDVIRLKSIDPKSTVQVVGLGRDHVYLEPTPMALHEGKRFNISSRMVPDEIAALFALVLEYPFVAFVIFLIMTSSAVLVLIMTPIAAVADKNLAFKARITTKKEVEKMITFLEYVKLHQPEKLAQA